MYRVAPSPQSRNLGGGWGRAGLIRNSEHQVCRCSFRDEKVELPSLWNSFNNFNTGKVCTVRSIMKFFEFNGAVNTYADDAWQIRTMQVQNTHANGGIMVIISLVIYIRFKRKRSDLFS